MEQNSIKAVDLRKALGVAPATLHDMCKKEGISPLPIKGSKSGKRILASDVRTLLEKRGFKYPATAKVISFIMCKGGVGKTTTSYFVGTRINEYGARVLLIDADPQGNLTSSFPLREHGYEINEETPVLTDIFANECTLKDAIIPLSDTLHIIPSTPMNATLESTLREKHKNPSTPMRRLIKSISKQYDFIFIDCAPALSLTNTVIMLASDQLILPVNPDSYSQIGLNQTLQEIEMTKQDFSDWKKIVVNVLFTKYDAREYTSLKYLSGIAKEHEKLLFRTTIRTSTQFKNAIDKKEDLFGIKSSSAKDDYDSLAREVMGIDKISKRSQH